ncbi:MAG: B12-binding domain-containing protein [Planctomycetota bacterium]|nr:B12-binding domain-containing protein [Planctomycetota bacterium]
MQEFVTPKQVARAIDVSESSVKRWCDRGIIPSSKTAGGHRRIPICAVLSYLRESHQLIVSPEILGLPATSGQTDWVNCRARDCLSQALLTGDEERCRQILFDIWLAGQPISTICDEVIAESFQQIGHRWESHDVDVYQERRACEIMARVLYEFRQGTPPGDPSAHALGGTIPEDQYVLPTTMVELVLQSCGWNARSIGNSVPFESMARAIRDLRPRIFWVSISYITDVPALTDGFRLINQAADQVGTAIVVGGFALQESVRQNLRYTAFCESMRHLADFATKFKGTPATS